MPQYGSKLGFPYSSKYFLVFLVTSQGPWGVGGGSTPEFFQGVYERLFKKVQTIIISRTHTVSASIWLKSSFGGFSSLLGILFGTFGVFPGAPRELVEGALLLNQLRGSMRGY